MSLFFSSCSFKSRAWRQTHEIDQKMVNSIVVRAIQTLNIRQYELYIITVYHHINTKSWESSPLSPSSTCSFPASYPPPPKKTRKLTSSCSTANCCLSHAWSKPQIGRRDFKDSKNLLDCNFHCWNAVLKEISLGSQLLRSCCASSSCTSGTEKVKWDQGWVGKGP